MFRFRVELAPLLLGTRPTCDITKSVSKSLGPARSCCPPVFYQAHFPARLGLGTSPSHQIPSRFQHSVTESVNSVCRDGTDMPYANGSLENSAKTAVVRLCGYLTFIFECSVTTKTVKLASNHRGSTKLEFVKTANLFILFFLLLFQTGDLNTPVSTHCSFSVNRQHFLARRSTISQNLHNF